MGFQSVKDFIIGIIMGAVSFLPGASGATIAVIFRIYDRLVADVADIRGKLFKDLRFVIPVGLGLVVGMIACAKGLQFLLDDFEIPMMFLFVALIVTQIPDIYKAGDDGKPLTTANIISFIVGFGIMIALMIIGFNTADNGGENPGFIILMIVGVIMAMSMLAPGISGSTVLVAIGLFTVYDNALANLDFKLLLPILVGLVIGALAFAKVIDYFMERSRRSTYAVILGLNAGSAVTVLVKAFRGLSGDEMILQSILCVFIGAAFGILLCRLAHIYSASSAEE